MSIEKLLKALASSINTRQEMRDMEDRPVPRKKCWCCGIITTNPDGTISSQFWYQATKTSEFGYTCAFSISGDPVQKYCDECGYLIGQRENGPSVVQ